jgi:hypothetical protein
MVNREKIDALSPFAKGGMQVVDAGNAEGYPTLLDARSNQPGSETKRLDTTAESLDSGTIQKTDSMSQGPDLSLSADVRSTDDSRGDTAKRDTSGDDLKGDSSTCQPACSATQSCIKGSCVTVSKTGTDDCLDTQAVNLTLQQLAVYQTVKIPIMDRMAELNASTRNADIIEGRDAMFRVFVTVGKNWKSRPLSARLTLTSGSDQPTVYFSKKNILASSADGNTTNTFQIFVPGSAITTDATYSLSIVECATQSGAASNVRFPSNGEIDLGVSVTGGLKIKIIPIQVGTLVPDTSETALAVYSKIMNAMYPITKADISVGEKITTTSPVNWTSMLDQLRAKRRTDNPAADVYYYGLVKPAATLRAYCTSTCTMGIGYVAGTTTSSASARVAVGTGFADKASAETMAHEVGHNHGREHAPCSPSGSLSGVDNSYPYTNGLIGSWGYDPRTQVLLDPAKCSDVMGYCSSKWISDYTYKALTNRVALLNSVRSEFIDPNIVMRYRVLILDESGPHWGIPFSEPGAPDGTPEEATIYDLQGLPLTQVTVYRTEIGDVEAAMVQVPEPKENWYAVGVKNSIPHPFAAPITVPRSPAPSR